MNISVLHHWSECPTLTKLGSRQ